MQTAIIEEDAKDILRELKDSISQLENKKILITGSGGMLGGYLVHTLIAANTYLFRKPAQLYLVIRGGKRPFGKKDYIHYLNIDIAKEVPRVKGMHYIIHAASKAAPKFYMVDRIDTMNTNILGLYHLLEICDKNLKSFLYFSSCDVYGEPSSNKPIAEDYIGKTNHLSERSSYAESKRICETISLNYFWERRLPIKIARIFHTFGPGLNLNDGRSFSDFIKSGLEKKDILIHGDSSKKRALLYVKDAAVMFFMILLSHKNGQIYNVGNDKNIVSIGEFAQIVCDAFNKRSKYTIRVLEKPSNKVDFYKGAVNEIRPDMSKFEKEFGYKAKTEIKEAIARTVDHYISLQTHDKQ